MRLGCFFAALVLSISFSVSAQEAPRPKFGPSAKLLIQFAEKYKAALSNELISEMPEHQAEIAKKVTIEISDSWNVYGTRSEPGKIVLTTGFLLAQDGLDRAVADAIMLEDYDDLEDYLEYQKDMLEKTYKATSESRLPPIIDLYCKHYRDLYTCNNIWSDPKYETLLEVIKRTSIGFVIGHELAHQVYHDVDNNNAQGIGEKEEARADLFSLNLLLKRGYYPVFLLGTFMTMEAYATSDVNNRQTYRPSSLTPACRYGKTISVVMDRARQDQNYTTPQIRKKILEYSNQWDQQRRKYSQICGF